MSLVLPIASRVGDVSRPAHGVQMADLQPRYGARRTAHRPRPSPLIADVVAGVADKDVAAAAAGAIADPDAERAPRSR